MLQQRERPLQPVFVPAIDIHETEQGLVLYADMPGVAKESLELSVENNVLQIYGRTHSQSLEEAEFVYQEFRCGDYYRSFILGEDVDTTKITANLADGVLTLHLPKTERSRRRKIDVTGQ